MPTAPNDFARWLDEKKEREARGAEGHIFDHRGVPSAECLHCHNPFPVGQGTITDDAAICDTCL